LTAPLEAALRTVVEAIPEPESTFQDVPGVAVAIGERAGNETSGSQHGSGVGTGGRSGERKRLHRATVVTAKIAPVIFLAVHPATVVFPTDVSVNIQRLRGVELESSECLVATEQSQRAVWTRRQVRQRGRAVPGDAIATQEVQADVEFLA